MRIEAPATGRAVVLVSDGVSDDLEPARLGGFVEWLVAEVGGLPRPSRRRLLRRELDNWPVPHHLDDKTVAVLVEAGKGMGVTGTRMVTSVYGNRYRLGRELGRGGQGAVFAVEGEVFAVKLLGDRSPHAQERLRDQLAMVGRLPLEDLAVARPIEQLRPPDVGYVMELFTGMLPLRSLLRPPKEAESVVRWYFAAAGSVAACGCSHVPRRSWPSCTAEGLSMSTRLRTTCSSLRRSTRARSGSLIRTTFGHRLHRGARSLRPATGRPRSSVRRRTDHPQRRLRICHHGVRDAVARPPFLGDVVQRSEPEVEEQALAGMLPWVDESGDDRNRVSTGIPRDVVLSENLREIFQKMFWAGRRSPAERPGMTRWAEYLHRAADRTLTCRRCGGSYYFNREACPWCEAHRPTFVIGAVLLWDPTMLRNCGEGDIEETPGIVRSAGGKPRVVDAVVVSLGEQMVLTDRITHGTDRGTPRLRVAFGEDRLRLEALDGERWRLVSADGPARARTRPSRRGHCRGAVGFRLGTTRGLGRPATSGASLQPPVREWPMKVCDVIHGRVATVELTRSDGERFPENLVSKAEVSLLKKDGSDLHLQMGEDIWPVAGASPRDQECLRQISTRNLPHLAWFVQGVPSKGAAERVLIQCHEFPTAFMWNEPVDIGVDDRIVEDMRKRRRGSSLLRVSFSGLQRRCSAPALDRRQP